jgi:hypothetical protein
MTRCEDSTWMLHGDPPDTLERLRAETAPARARALEEDGEEG